jgi:plastocyanin
MKRSIITLAAVAALALPFSAPAGTNATTKLAGVTGPGFTITLKKAGKKVTTLKPGSYKITVSDKSAAHDFWIVGPGVKARQVTGLGFTGTRSATVTLRKGRYEFYCKPHRRMGMRGFFTVK